MKKIVFTPAELAGYFNGTLMHKGYLETVNEAADLCTHADGIFPKKMIEERRPSESKEVKDYREKIWQPVTQPIFQKVITELHKIRRSADWAIKYDPAVKFPAIAEGESLYDYCEQKYPTFGSITNWLFTLVLPMYSKDANALILVMPEADTKPNEYLRPFGYVFAAKDIIDYKDNDYAVIKSSDKVLYTKPDGQKEYGNVFYIVTTLYIQRWEQVDGTMKYSMKSEYQHNLGYLPAFKVKGIIKKSLDDLFIYKSRLSPMAPRLNEYAREYSDMQAGIVSHLYLEKWEYTTEECPECKGKCTVSSDYGRNITCPTCDGEGSKKRGPYTIIKVKAPMSGENQPPMPPAGYIQKDGAIIELQDKRLDAHEYKALSAINMEYLSQVPLSQSGVAKEVDRDALNNLVNAIAEDLVAIADNVYRITCDMRYGIIVSSPYDRKSMLPYIPVPERFDMLSSAYLEDQIKRQKDNNINPAVMNAVTEEYVSKKFSGDKATLNRVLAMVRLDPLAGLTEDEKMVRLNNNGISQVVYYLSCNMKLLVDRAVDEKGDAFYSMPVKQQKEILYAYAENEVKGMSAAGKVIDLVDGEGSAASGGGVIP